VCACSGVGFRPRPRHAAAASAAGGRATRPPAHRHVKGGGSSEIAKRAGRCPQVVNTLWATDPSPAAMGSGSWSRPNAQGSPLLGRPVAGSRMEGTSGAADPGPLRGGAEHAALGGIAEGTAPNGAALPGRETLESVPRPAQRRSLQPATPRFHDERCPSGSGWEKTLCRSSERTTPEREAALERGALLTREDSTGERPSRLDAG